ncbi:unnamed protein product [Paramecium sonneborni]|uniref:Uncharacterized protein n=1 Tax=Paramecium sonneborni TaxID=65129 RepID=A0A8S1Q137_9CILI|nr:unnamed protein product [Paramecium sonneborni]
MQYHVSQQDVLGTLQDVFLISNQLQEDQKHYQNKGKHLSDFEGNLDNKTSKTRLDRYLEKYQQRKQIQVENNSSQSQSIQNANIIKVQQKLNDSQTAYSSKMSLPRESSENDDKEQHLIGAGLSQYMQQLQQSKLQCIYVNQECQTEELKQYYNIQGQNELVFNISESNNSMIDIIKLLSSKHNQQNTICEQIQLSLQIQKEQSLKKDFFCQFNTEIKLNQQIDNQQIKQICHCNQKIKKPLLNDFGCQYDESLNQVNIILNNEHPKNIRSLSRCLTSANQNNKNSSLNSDDQITFLEQELQLREELLETKTRIITDMQQQLSEYYKFFNKENNIEQENDQEDQSVQKERVDWKVNELNRQIEENVEIQDQLTQIMLKQSDEILELKKVLDETTEQNFQLREEQEQLIIQIVQYKQQLIEIQESKVREINLINQDYQDKLSKQNMIIDELQSQIKTIQTNTNDIPQLQNTLNNIPEHQIDEFGLDSQCTKDNNLTAQNVLKNINKMTTMTAGLMSNKQDYVTLEVLGRIDQSKSLTILDYQKKTN